jgi:cell division protein FtsB
MIRHRLLVAAFVGITAYLAMAFVYGPGGLVAYRRMQDYRRDLEANIVELAEIHERLSARIDALSTDPEAVRLQAHALGYIAEDERVIRIEGYERRRNSFAVGRVVRRKDVQDDPTPVFRGIALSAAVATYLLLSLGRRDAGR